MNMLEGQHAVVTGGSRGIGAAIARALAAQGASITVMGRDVWKLNAVAHETNGNAIECDVTRQDSITHAFGEAVAANGPIHLLINNAGAAESAPLRKTTVAMWQRMLDTNLTSAFLCTQQVVAGMIERGHGRLVNIASTAGLVGYAYVCAYVAAKHGLIGLTRALAMELALTGVTVNAVCPGYTDTDLVAHSVENIARKTGRGKEDAIAALVKNNPQQRLVQPEEVADAVVWLCGAGNGAMNGQAIAVAGGEVMH